MIVIYHCWGSAHSSILAAHLHLGSIGVRRPAIKEIAQLEYFDYLPDQQVGIPVFCGEDHYGNLVYAVGFRQAGQAAVSCLKGILGAVHVRERILFAETLHLVNLWTRLGGFLSRHCGIRLGRYLCAFGLWLRYRQFADFVEEVKLDCQHESKA